MSSRSQRRTNELKDNSIKPASSLFASVHHTGNILLCQAPETSFFFSKLLIRLKHVKLEEKSRRKRVPGCSWAKKIQRQEVTWRKPCHAHSSTCAEEKHLLEDGKQDNRNALPPENFWSRAAPDRCLLLGGWVWIFSGRRTGERLGLSFLSAFFAF